MTCTASAHSCLKREPRARSTRGWEAHDLPDDLLLGPGVRHALAEPRGGPVTSQKSIGLGLDDVEDLLTEGLDSVSWHRDPPMPG